MAWSLFIFFFCICFVWFFMYISFYLVLAFVCFLLYQLISHSCVQVKVKPSPLALFLIDYSKNWVFILFPLIIRGSHGNQNFWIPVCSLQYFAKFSKLASCVIINCIWYSAVWLIILFSKNKIAYVSYLPMQTSKIGNLL